MMIFNLAKHESLLVFSHIYQALYLSYIKITVVHTVISMLKGTHYYTLFMLCYVYQDSTSNRFLLMIPQCHINVPGRADVCADMTANALIVVSINISPGG